MNRDQLSMVYTVAGVVGFLLLVIIGYQFFKPDTYLKFSSPDGYSVEYPEGWVANRQKVAGISAMFEAPSTGSFDTFGENVNIVVQDLSRSPKSLGAFTETAIRQMKVVFSDELTSLEEASIKIDGQAGYKFVFVTHSADVDVQIMCVWTLKNDRAYQITYTALTDTYEDYSEQVNKMIASFKFK